MLYEYKSIIDTDHVSTDAEQAGQAVAAPGPAGPGAGIPHTAAVPLPGAAGILNGSGPREFMAGIDAGNRRMGNRAFMRRVGELRARGQDEEGLGVAPGDGRARQTPCPDGQSGPLQLMPKKKKKKAAPDAPQAPERQLETPPDCGATATPVAQAKPEAPSVPEKTPPHEWEKATETAGVVEQKKRKKSRVQVALNILRSKSVEAFAGYIEAEIAEVELLHNLRARISRAQNLTGISNDALGVIGKHLRRLDPDAFPGQEHPAEMPVNVPVKTELNRREADLVRACEKGDVAWLKRLIKLNVDVNLTSQFGTPLGTAVANCHKGIVRELLSRPEIDANLAHVTGTIPLFLAVHLGHVEIVRLLLDARGINVNLAAPDGTTPLCVAAFLGHEEITRLLLAAPNINLNARAGDQGATALLFAAQEGKVEVVKLLLAARGVNVNLRLSEGTTALCVAAYKGHDEVVELILATPNVDVDARKDDGATALVFAAESGFTRIVELLCKHGADVNLPTYPGSTPLSIAIYFGHVEAVRVLLRAPGVRVNQGNRTGVTPLGVATRQGRKDIVRMLLRKGADPNRADINGVAPLHVACLKGYTDIARMLLNSKAASNMQVRILKDESCTPYDLARLRNHREIMAVLAAHWRALAARLETLLAGLRPAESTPAYSMQDIEDEQGPTTPPLPAPGPLPSPLTESPPAPVAAAATQTAQFPVFSPADAGPDILPAPEATLSPLEQGKQGLIREILYKLDQDTLEPLEGIRMLMDVKSADSPDALCSIYNRLAGMERQRQRVRRRGVRRGLLSIGTSTPAPTSEETEPRFALDDAQELDAEAVEDEIRIHLAQAYHKFVSQAVNNMEFGRGKPTSGYPGLWHVSAGIPGVGSCCVFYYTDVTGMRIRIVGIGHHVDRAVYRLVYAAEELGGVGRVLRIA